MNHNKLRSFKKKQKRVGRGPAAGQGKTCGRGHKGQKARTGKKLRAGFEGGQTPIFQRLPKYRGFKNINRVEYQVVNLNQLNELKEKNIDRAVLLQYKLVRHKSAPIKVLANGELKQALNISLDCASQSAIQKIEKAGGKFTSSTQNNSSEKQAKETGKTTTKTQKE